MHIKSHIVFLTTSSLASNPRLVKEFEALKKDFNCSVLCFKHHDWSLELSEAIKKRNSEVHFIEIDRKSATLQTILCKVIHKSAILLNPFFSKNFKISAFASNDKASQLWLQIKNLPKEIKVARVIAHNLGAFYAAVKYSEKNDVAMQLDIEDYYPGEALYFNKSYETQNRMHIMKYSFLKADTITYASKGIQLECEQHFNVKRETKQVTLINAFKASDFSEPKVDTSEKIKCVWFSQHIGPNRGLEQVFKAARDLSHIEFNLIGNYNKDFLDRVAISDNIKVHAIMEQEQLHEFLSRMDLGLALENVNADRNRNICLTNKFLAYAQAGLYILATDTFGQTQFLKALDYDAGLIMVSTLKEALQQLDKTSLTTSSKIKRWQSAKLFSWDNEQLKLKKLLS